MAEDKIHGFKWEKRTCVDCGKEFIAKSPRALRCHECRYKRELENAKKWRDKKQAEKKAQEQAVVKRINPDICTHLDVCKYAGEYSGFKFCDYLSINKKRRPCRAGECQLWKEETSDEHV